MTVTYIPYAAPLLGNIRQILTGLQGFDSMAREIIQNADDAGATKIHFSIEPNCLRIWNDATFLSCGSHDRKCSWEVSQESGTGSRKACDFHAISTVGSGNKYRDSSLIGRFGIGFVSVYQITDSPIIRSLTVQLELDPLEGRSRVSKIDNLDGSEFELPWAFDPNSPTREELNASAIQPEGLEAVQSDLLSVANDCLLFLRNLRSIEIVRNGRTLKHVVRKSIDEKRIKLTFLPENQVEDWYVIHSNADQEAIPLREKYPRLVKLARQTQLQIAFKISDSDKWSGRLFAYLPTEQPSPVPCHINADFFPEQNRKALVLSGEQHERHWNEMLLGVAARVIAQHLLELRDVLKPAGLWKLIGDAYQYRETEHFGHFWREIAISTNKEIVWTAGKRWLDPEKCFIPTREITKEEERSLAHISIDLIHRSLRPFQNPLETLGARRLSLASLVDALQEWDKTQLDKDILDKAAFADFINPLWRLTDSLISSDNSNLAVSRNSISRLKDVRFAPGSDARLTPISGLCRSPESITNKQIIARIDLPLVEESFATFEHIHTLIDLLSFDRLLVEIAARVTDNETARDFFGPSPTAVRDFYRFFSSYPRPDDDEIDVNEISDSPILAGKDRFLTPREAVLPGDFQDPVGRFNTIDITHYDDRSQEFLRDILKVQTLTLNEYIRKHLLDILKGELPNDLYVALMDQLSSHRTLLDDKEIRRLLTRMPIVKVMDGTMKFPADCYFKGDEIQEILGNQEKLWVDLSIYKPVQRDVVRAFLNQLGIRRRPSLNHAINRIDEIVEDSPSEATQRSISVLLSFVFQLFDEDHLAEKEDEFSEEIDRLRQSEWLPAIVDGSLDENKWYAPHELYQPFRSTGFDTQVPVLAIRARRQLSGEFLDFLEMPDVPETSIIVGHLIHCVEHDKQVSDTTYQILNEKFNAEEDISSIELLRSQKCVYSPKLNSYISTDKIFWNKPRLRPYCFPASEWMHRYKELFDFLGVLEEPRASTYVGVLIDIAEEYGRKPEPLPADIKSLHGVCLSAISTEVREKTKAVDVHLDELFDHPFLLTIAGTLAFVDETVIKDSEWLAEPFNDELNGCLVQASPEHIDFLEWLHLKSLSSVIQIEGVRLGEAITDEDATLIIEERRALLLWMFAGLRSESRKRINDAFHNLQVLRTDFIQVRSIFSLTDPPIVSAPKSELIFFDRTDHKLYVHLDLGEDFWITALRVIFSTVVLSGEGADIPTCSLAGSQVLSAGSTEKARKKLEQAGYSPLSSAEANDIDFEETDLGDISEEEFLHEDKVDPEHDGEDKENISEEITEEEASGNSQLPDSNRNFVGLDGVERQEEREEIVVRREGNESQRVSHKEKTNRSEQSKGDGTRSVSEDLRPSNQRTEWMRSYVVPQQDMDAIEADANGEEQHALTSAIDESAMNAVLGYEAGRNCIVERKPHFHPGYDIISRSKTSSERRLIEVKGLHGEWRERGVKLSRTQIMNAEEYGDEFWLYVVEYALDSKNRKIHAIKNPFFKAAEFWFDHAWREVADEHGGDLQSQFTVGKRIEVEHWGQGTIIEVQQRGIATSIKIDFSMRGIRSLPLNLSQMKLVED